MGRPHDKNRPLYCAASGRSDLNDLADDERKELQKGLDAYLEKLLTAPNEDIADAGPGVVAKAAGQSTATKLSVIAASIPHPKLDAALSKIEMTYLWDIFAPKYIANRALSPPPPGGKGNHNSHENGAVTGLCRRPPRNSASCYATSV